MSTSGTTTLSNIAQLIQQELAQFPPAQATKFAEIFAAHPHNPDSAKELVDSAQFRQYKTYYDLRLAAEGIERAMNQGTSSAATSSAATSSAATSSAATSSAADGRPFVPKFELGTIHESRQTRQPRADDDKSFIRVYVTRPNPNNPKPNKSK